MLRNRAFVLGLLALLVIRRPAAGDQPACASVHEGNASDWRDGRSGSAKPAQYYVVPAGAITGHKENFGKRSGLYFSPANAEGKFMLITDHFDFRQVIIHPVTHKLYAHIVWRRVYMRSDGLVAQDLGLVAVSDNGLRWKDVTSPESPNRLPTDHPIGVQLVGSRLVPDPEHEKRICVVVDGAFGFVLLALDDEHTKWEFASRQWQRNHPSVRPAPPRN